jgi:hypothetical protein
MTSRSKNSAYDTKESRSEERSETMLVNSGLQNFEQIRSEWRTSSGKFSTNPSATQRGYNPHYQQQMRRNPPGSTAEPTPAAVDPDVIIERLFSGSGNGTLPESIPLGQMIQILTDVWETEGLYD